MTIFAACSDTNVIYEKHLELSPDVEWLKADVRSFEFQLEGGKRYDLNIDLRYAQGMPFRTVPLKAFITMDGNTSEEVFLLQLRNEDGSYIGEPGFDIWDSSHHVGYLEPTQSGMVRIVLSHDMPNDVLPFAMEIGVVVKTPME